MTSQTPAPISSKTTDPAERRKLPREQIAVLERRTWHLWAVSLTITVALALAVAALFYPAIKWDVQRVELHHGALPQLVIGLLTLVFLESFYIIQKQRELNELRNFIISSHTDAFLVGGDFPVDPLTGVLDRRCLPDLVKRECAWVDRYHIPLSLVLFDIREFGKLNEKEGNLAGDLVLKELAGTLRATMRQSDSILRHGADAFLCFLARTDRAGSEGFVRRALQACQNAGRLCTLCLEYGLAVYESGMDSDRVVTEAEQDLETTRVKAQPLPETQPTAVERS